MTWSARLPEACGICRSFQWCGRKCSYAPGMKAAMVPAGLPNGPRKSGFAAMDPEKRREAQAKGRAAAAAKRAAQ